MNFLHLLRIKGAVNKDADVDGVVCTTLNYLGTALWYAIYLNSEYIASAVSNRTIYTMHEAWPGFAL